MCLTFRLNFCYYSVNIDQYSIKLSEILAIHDSVNTDQYCLSYLRFYRSMISSILSRIIKN